MPRNDTDAERVFLTPIKVLEVDETAGTIQAIVVGFHMTRSVTLPLAPILADTGLTFDKLTSGMWLEAKANCNVKDATALDASGYSIAPDLPDDWFDGEASG